MYAIANISQIIARTQLLLLSKIAKQAVTLCSFLFLSFIMKFYKPINFSYYTNCVRNSMTIEQKVSAPNNCQVDFAFRAASSYKNTTKPRILQIQ